MDPILILSPQELAADMIKTFRDQMQSNTNERNPRYAVHRAAEVRAWELSKTYGADTPKGRHFAKAAFEVAEYYHDVQWKNEGHNHHVPVLNAPPQYFA